MNDKNGGRRKTMQKMKGFKQYLFDPAKDEVYNVRESKYEIRNTDGYYLLKGDNDKIYSLTETDAKLLTLEDYKARKNLIYCSTLDTYYKTPREAAKHMNVSDTTVYNIVKSCEDKQFSIRDLDFEIIDAVVRDADLQHPTPYFEDSVDRYVPNAKKKVMCVESGRIYDSVSDASKDAGVTPGYLGQLIKKHKLCNNRQYKFVE